MFKNQRWSEKKARKEEIQRCFETAKKFDPEGEEYYKVMQRISDLHKHDRQKLNANTVFNGVASFIPVIAIILYENAGNIIKTKAIQWVPRIRL